METISKCNYRGTVWLHKQGTCKLMPFAGSSYWKFSPNWFVSKNPSKVGFTNGTWENQDFSGTVAFLILKINACAFDCFRGHVMVVIKIIQVVSRYHSNRARQFFFPKQDAACKSPELTLFSVVSTESPFILLQFSVPHNLY